MKKTINSIQRMAIIINKACALGYEPCLWHEFSDVATEAELYLIDNAPIAAWDEIEFSFHGNNQHFSWGDAYGHCESQTGDIVDFAKHWFDSPETKVPVIKVVDSEGDVIQLYYTVGMTEYNAPDGYILRNGKHVAGYF